MLKLYLSLRHLWADKRGVSAIEYALLAAGLAVGLAALADGGAFAMIQDAITGSLNTLTGEAEPTS